MEAQKFPYTGFWAIPVVSFRNEGIAQAGLHFGLPPLDYPSQCSLHTTTGLAGSWLLH